MSDEYAKPDWDKLKALFTERMRWANLSVTIEEIAKENKKLIRDLSRFDPTVAIPLLAGLLTIPKLQSHCVRLEILVALCVVYCCGRKKPSINQVTYWFSQIGESQCVLAEDPAEDIFVSLVQDKYGDYKLLEGNWENAGFYTQRIIDVVSTMPDSGHYNQIKKSVHALLVISDIICEKAGLYRYQLGSEDHYTSISPRILPESSTIISSIKITFNELYNRGISRNDIEPFILNSEMQAELPSQQIGLSYLDQYPLIIQGTEQLTVVLPSAISVAIREYVIKNIIEGDLVDTFDYKLAKTYSNLISETPLLGGPMQAPVQWRMSGDHRYASFSFPIDNGHFISFHLFLPSLRTHPKGGFKEVFQDDGALTETLQASINDALTYFNEMDNFREGLFILVGCGWGKGYTTQVLELDHPHWRFVSISVADLVRLSRLGEMNPSYFWRIQDGLEVVNKAGVQLIDINGIMNLIGWVRSNNGHFVPHEQLPDGKISPENPLSLTLPTNLLRDVRADADQGCDRHSVIDNTGALHNVQYISPRPMFHCESKRRLYASIDDLRIGKFTSVYKGTNQLWISISVPNISDREVEYKLWEMACEWLHRIGNALDEDIEPMVEMNNFKIYVEFHDDEIPNELVEKPTHAQLLPLCVIESYSEPNASKVVFKTGFLSGFNLAENIAERLFVRTITRAYMQLLGSEDCDNKAKVIEATVVPNNDARSFHFFYAQKFIDYIRDTLTRQLIVIDPIDDAAAKIGLGWRATEKDESNKIVGKEDCTKFLGKIVDTILNEIFDGLKEFNRLTTLIRLMENCEKAYAEEDHWKRTSAAVLGLHGNKSSTINRFVEQMSKFASAGMTSRILIEIALCVCPQDNDKHISDIELSKLIARAGMVIQFGGLSDAIYYNALAPELNISPLGNIIFRNEFGKLVVEPMLTDSINERIIANSHLQKRNYEEPEYIPDAKERVSDVFWNIWNIEMGFDLNEARNIIGTLEDKCIENHSLIIKIKRSEYLKLICSENISEDTAIKFLDQFSLTTRPHWVKPPLGFNLKDIYPWRFGRRLSYVTRPILKIDISTDPLLLIAPASLRRGFAYVVDGAYRGRLGQNFFQSKEMRDLWWGKTREGHTFNAEVANALLQAGWNVRENIELSEILNRKIKQDYGDIDVLAWRPDRKEVLVVECKDLSMARNYSEIAAMLSDYQGKESNGKPDKLKRHLNRVSFLQENLANIQYFTGVGEPNILSCLIFSGVVPMQYAKIEALENTHVGEIKDIMKI